MATKHQRTLTAIVETDRRQAQARAEDAYLGECLELAPHSYLALREARDAGTLDALLAQLPAHLVRAQAVRFLVERRRETGALWGWGDVADVAARFTRAAARATAQVAA
jgi:hypothetical protein